MKRRSAPYLPNLVPGEHQFDLYTEGDDLYEAMLAAIAKARAAVWLETYIFADDEIGRRFADALMERAREDLDVRVHLDAAGSLFWLSPGLVHRMRNGGVKVRWFHRWSWRNPWRYNRRDHRKLLVIDASLAFLGGFNIHRENSQEFYGPHRWRDTHVAVRDQLARQAAQIYSGFWRGRVPRQDETERTVSAILLTNHSRRYRHRLRAFYADIFRRARGNIFITTPYFIPDMVIQNVLLAAAARGVDVRLLLPAHSDTRVARWAARALYARLLDGGVKIYEYQPRMLHAKTASVDCLWCTVGTANLDYRSFFTNYEINLLACDPALAERLHKLFLQDMEECRRILPDEWRQRFWLDRLPEWFGWLLRRWL